MTHKGALILLSLAVLAFSGCGGKSGEGQAGNLNVRNLNFRSVADTDPILARRYESTEGHYSIRPPAGWLKSPASTLPARGKIRGYALFRDKATGEEMNICSPASDLRPPDITMLRQIREGIIRTAKNNPKSTMLGTDIYGYRGRYFVQALAREGDWVFLQLSVFTPEGGMTMLEYKVRAERYQAMARALEGSIASLLLGEPAK
jgi:hypothetical protein